MVAPPGGRAFREVATGITMGTAPMEIPAATSLNGGRVTILKSDVPYAHFCMGIRTIAVALSFNELRRLIFNLRRLDRDRTGA